MKKSKRLLSILLAITMLLGTVSVFASAASHSYKDNNITYNDVDSPVFTKEQYASMAVDEVDRMLAEENLVLDVYVLTLDLTSVDNALKSVANALNSVSSLLPLLNDAKLLDLSAFWVDANTTVSRSNKTDFEILEQLLQFLADNTITTDDDDNTTDGVITLYAKGSINLGVVQSLVSDYVFNLRELAICLLYSLIDGDSEYDYFDDGTAGVPPKYLAAGGFDILAQDLLNYFVLGEWVKLDDYFDLPLTDDDHRDFEDYFDGTRDAGKDYYGWFHRDSWVTYALGGTAIVNAGAAAPQALYSSVDINSAENGYDFIENLIRIAYNQIAVPVLNRETRPWLRELCGVTYLREKMDPSNEAYVQDYDGEPYEAGSLDPVLSALFDVDGMYVPEAVMSGTLTTHGALDANGNIVYTSTAQQLQFNYSTFIGAFNTTLGQFIEAIIKAPQGENTWTWYYGSGQDGDNAFLFKNICKVARYVLGVTQGAFFSDYIKTKSADEYNNMNDQQVVSFILRAVLNSSVSWMYISDDYQTVAEVGYEACRQLAYQDIPQFTYTKPEKGTQDDATYNRALVDSCIDILMDVAVFNLNQNMDMVPANGSNPLTDTGLLQYTHDYEPLVLQVVAWAIETYGPAIAVDFLCDDADGATTGLTINSAWSDIDTLINSIIPIKGEAPWLNAGIANQQYVVKSLIFDNIIASLTNLDSTGIAAIFEKNSSGEFATKNVKSIAIGLVERVLELIFPNLITSAITQFDQILETNTIASIVQNLINILNNRRVDILSVALPIVCDSLGLSDQQEFKEMEVYMPSVINAADAQANNVNFKVYNGSQGLNTAYTDEYGIFTQDSLYKYEILSATIKPDNSGISVTGLDAVSIKGGEGVNVKLSGNFSSHVGEIIELVITYNVYGEDGTTALTSAPLTSSTYAYVGNTLKGDDEIMIEESMSNGYKAYHASDIYIDRGDRLTDVEGYSVMFKADDDNAAIALNSVSLKTKPTTAVPAGSAIAPSGLLVTSTERNSVSSTQSGGQYYLFPYSVATYTDTTVTPNEVKKYDLYKEWEKVTKDPNTGDEITTIENNGGIAHGLYTASATFTASGEQKTFNTRIHLYNDYGLGSAYNSAVGSNRQLSAYNTTMNNGAANSLFNNYTTAVRNAAKLILAPKSGANFESSIAATDGVSANLYEQYATALEDAITALKPYEKSAAVTDIEAEIAKYSPVNYSYTVTDGKYYKTELEYDDDGYVFFGMRDFVPHTYHNYKNARNHAQNLINSQIIFAPEKPELSPTASQYEYSQYLEAMVKYDKAYIAYTEALENIAPLGAVDAVYATHMVNLMGERLISLPADKSKLQQAYDLYNRTNGTAANLLENTNEYTSESWNNYVRACDFARETLAMSTAQNPDGTYNLRPSRVNKAISELVKCWKRLVSGADTSALQSAITRAETILNDANLDTTYTADSIENLRNVYNDACALIASQPAVSDANNQRISEAALAIDNAIAALKTIAALEPEWSLETEPGMWMDDEGNETVPFVSAEDDDIYRYDFGSMTDTQSFLFGLGTYVDDSLVDSAFVNVTNATVEISESSFPGGYGTGARAEILNSSGETVYEYYVVIIGDLNGDGYSADNTDLTYFSYMIANAGGKPDPFTPIGANEAAIVRSGDINCDVYTDGSDYSLLKYVNACTKTINQQDFSVT